MNVPEPLVRAAVRVIAPWSTDPRRSFAAQRRRLERLSVAFSVPRGTSIETITVAGVPCERVLGNGARDERVIVYLHGGGYCIGSARDHRGFAARLSQATGAAVVVPDYRLAPENPYPAAADDSLDVWLAVASQHPGAVLCGDSAGGGLALLTAIRARDGAAPRPSAVALVSPWLDAAADRTVDPDLLGRDVVISADWLARCALSYAAGRPLSLPGISPINHDMAGLPPVFVVVGTEEVLHADSQRLVKKIRAAGGEVTAVLGNGLWHIYPTQAGVFAAADEALASLATFIAGHLGAAEGAAAGRIQRA